MPVGSGVDEDDWLWDALGLAAEVTEDVTGAGLRGLVGLALRRNPRRAHLLVSRVLGKHLPVWPADALGAGTALAAMARARSAAVRASLASGGPVFVLGYCETATALGHAVADGLPGAGYLHTTRRAVAGMRSELELAEAHSHAVHHWLLPADRRLLTDPRPLLLVDDELSTGNTAIGTIRALHALAPRPAYTVAALLDARPARARAEFDRLADELGVPVDVVSLVSATVQVPPDVAERARALRERFAAPGPGAADAAGRPVSWMRPRWPAELPDGGRHGWTPAHGRLLDEVVDAAGAAIAARLATPAGRTLVLGTEELMYTPMRLAAALAGATGGDVRYQSTTRSPVYPLDVPGYAIRSALEFPAPDAPSRVSQVYNVGLTRSGGPTTDAGPAAGRYDDIVLVVDDGADAAAPGHPDGPALTGLVEALRRQAQVTVVTLPSFVPEGAR
nr:phosphoribosyltransferase family protein [Pseudofrankia sp. DC12]